MRRFRLFNLQNIIHNCMSTEHVPTQPSSPHILARGRQKVMSATLFSMEVVLRSLVIPAAVATGIAPWNIGSKVQAWVIAPVKIYDIIKTIPQDIENIEKIIQIVDKPWSIEKIRELIQVGRVELARVYKKEKERFSDIVEWYKNYREMPTRTLASIIIVIAIYLLLASSIRLIRLGDRDTWMDSTRKKIARALGLWKASGDLSDKQLEATLTELLAEYKKRGF